MRPPSPLRFLWEILKPSRAALLALFVVLSFAIYLAATSSDGFESALVVVFATQLVAASTGYRDRLVRGHFDGLLAGLRRRTRVALLHAGLSMLPGLAVWLAFGAASRAFSSRAAVELTTGGAAAFVYASIVVWTVSLWLGKNSGGVLWFFVLFVLAAAGKVHLLREAYGTVSADWSVSARAAAAALAFPILMFSNDGDVEPPVLALVGLATGAVLVAGVWTIARLDAPLRDPS